MLFFPYDVKNLRTRAGGGEKMWENFIKQMLQIIGCKNKKQHYHLCMTVWVIYGYNNSQGFFKKPVKYMLLTHSVQQLWGRMSRPCQPAHSQGGKQNVTLLVSHAYAPAHDGGGGVGELQISFCLWVFLLTSNQLMSTNILCIQIRRIFPPKSRINMLPFIPKDFSLLLLPINFNS